MGKFEYREAGLVSSKCCPNFKEILFEWRTAWNLTSCRVTQHLVWFQAVCKGLNSDTAG